jgi:hypothetical protein
MERYARRHASLQEDRELVLLADFDELHDHFQDVEFPVRRAMQLQLDRSSMQSYGDRFHINIERFEQMNEFYSVGNVQNSNVIIRSKVANSFNSIVGKVDDDVADGLRLLGQEVANSENAEAAEIYEELSVEIAKDQPRKSLIKALWGGIAALLPSVASIAGIVAAIEKIAS